MSQSLWNVIYNPKKDQYDLYFRDQYVTDFLDECEATHMAYQLHQAYDSGYRAAIETVLHGRDPREMLETLDKMVFTEEF